MANEFDFSPKLMTPEQIAALSPRHKRMLAAMTKAQDDLAKIIYDAGLVDGLDLLMLIAERCNDPSIVAFVRNNKELAIEAAQSMRSRHIEEVDAGLHPGAPVS